MITIKDKVIAEEKKKLPNITMKEEPVPTTEEDSTADGKQDTPSEAEKTEDAECVPGPEAIAEGLVADVVQADPVTVAPGEEKMECEEGEATANAPATEDNITEVTIINGLTEAHHEAMIRWDFCICISLL